MTIVNCIRFKPKKGLEEDCFKALSDYETKYPIEKRVAGYVLDIDDWNSPLKVAHPLGYVYPDYRRSYEWVANERNQKTLY